MCVCVTRKHVNLYFHLHIFLFSANRVQGITLSDVYQAITCLKAVSAHGLARITIKFNHARRRPIQDRMRNSKHFPHFNTCACILYLPVPHQNYQAFKDIMKEALQNLGSVISDN